MSKGKRKTVLDKMKKINKTKGELLQEISELRQEITTLKEQHKEKLRLSPSTESHDRTTQREFQKDLSFENTGNINSGPNDKNKVMQLFNDYLRMYATRDDLLTNHFSDDFSGFTGGGDFLVKDKEEWVAITRQDFAQVKENIRIDLKDVSVQPLDHKISVATGFFNIHLPMKDHVLSREMARLVLIFRKESEDWKICHSSISIPYYLVREGEVYPMQELVKKNELLEELIAERTTQLSELNDDLQMKNEELAKEISERKKAEDDLRASEEKYHLLVDKADEAIVVVQDDMLKLTNPMAAKMTGYSEEEIRRTPFQYFVHPEDRYKVVNNYQNRLDGNTVPGYYIFRLLHKDGSIRWVHMNAVLIEWEGRPAILDFFTDITELKLAQESLKESNQKLEAIISASPDGIGMISLDWIMQIMSDKLPKMYGYTEEQKDEFIGRSALDFIDPSNHQKLLENMQKLLLGKADNKLNEYVAIRKDGSRFYVELKASLMLDSKGKPAGILFVERDITERKEAESIIQKQYRQLEELNATKDKFFSIVAHDLRSPFQALLSSSELLYADIEELSQDEIKFFSKELNDNLRNLYAFMENLLKWSMMQRKMFKYQPEDLNLSAEVNKIIIISNQIAIKKNIILSEDIDKTINVNADADMLRLVLQNLITNAIKFTPIDGRIIVSSAHNDDFVELSIKDNGIGMTPDIISELFNISKLSTTKGTAGERGTGLGLQLCKEFVQINGGDIRCESESGKGSTFTFTLRKVK